MPNVRSPQSTAWCFTLNNYTEDERSAIQELCASGSVQYLCFGEEVGGINAVPHLQGYLELSRKSRLGGVKGLRGLSRAHLECRRGTSQQAIEYCRKDGIFSEYGIRKQQGRRTDLESCRDLLLTTGSIHAVAEHHFNLYIQYRRGFESFLHLQQKPRTAPTMGYWYWGPTGSGKTRKAFAVGKQLGDVFFTPDIRGQWFDGYTGQESVIFDDLTIQDRPPIALLLRLLDRYPLQVPIKGGFTGFTSRRVFFTSNFEFDRVYGGEPNVEALRRRFARVQYIGVEQPPIEPLEVPGFVAEVARLRNHNG